MRSVEELNEQIRSLMLASGGWLSEEQRVVYADLVTAWALASRHSTPTDAPAQDERCPGPTRSRTPRRARPGHGPVAPIPHPSHESRPEDPVTA
ncbi:hypothetical protein ACTWJ8_33340 [Streptomyces sp. SDT5-1]|uniref:hypothetical protein n=1 Tax=Streptomyces sp. SDT5-1 TaxID=3406418 RepID=UPI003FD555D4